MPSHPSLNSVGDVGELVVVAYNESKLELRLKMLSLSSLSVLNPSSSALPFFNGIISIDFGSMESSFDDDDDHVDSISAESFLVEI